MRWSALNNAKSRRCLKSKELSLATGPEYLGGLQKLDDLNLNMANHDRIIAAGGLKNENTNLG